MCGVYTTMIRVPWIRLRHFLHTRFISYPTTTQSSEFSS